MLLLDTNILIDAVRGETIALWPGWSSRTPGHQRDQLDRGAGGLPRG